MVNVLRAKACAWSTSSTVARVYVFGNGEAKINLLGPDGSPALIWAGGMSRGEIRHAMRIVVEHQMMLLKSGRGHASLKPD